MRSILRDGHHVDGVMIFEFFTPAIPTLMEQAGASFILYDMEHTGISFDGLRDQVSYCRGLSVQPMVRVPRGQYSFLARALDIGMRGVMIPMVESLKEAQEIVQACRYPPQGRRGAAFGFAHDHYQSGDPAQIMHQANEDIVVIAQIETERGLEAVDDIAACEGIDVLWIGHFDLTNFLGIPGQFDHPLYKDAVAKTVQAARRHGKACGIMAANATWAEQYKALGFSMIAYGPDHQLLKQAMSDLINGGR
ncbi:MAG: hypothetical protein EBT20_11390 [Alphaproteobacteria bacterium]|jgi:2-keto-3-deoxy-L-rhamnonate aldolase RhmA|nr:hypothetical protein [Alphaproteobacteria bacterium]